MPVRLVSDDVDIEKSEYLTIEITDLGEGLRIPKEGGADIVRIHTYEIPRLATFTEVADYAQVFSEVKQQFPVEPGEADGPALEDTP